MSTPYPLEKYCRKWVCAMNKFILTCLIVAFWPGVISSAEARVFNIPDGKYFELRQAINAANDTPETDTIVLAQDGFYRPGGAVTLDTITTPVRIYGQGATIDAGNADGGKMLDVGSEGHLVLTDLNILNISYSSNGFVTGGVIENEGFATLRNVTIAGTRIDNSTGATFGVAIANIDTISLSNVTLSDNQGNGNISGSALYNAGTASLRNVTITSNGHSNGGEAPAVDTAGGEDMVLASSIIAGNPGGDCTGVPTSTGGNIDSDGSCNLDQQSDQPNTSVALQALADNGSGVLTHALPADSAAVNAGDNAACIPMDARGVVRAQVGGVGVGNRCDSGAFERKNNVVEFSASITGTWFDPAQPGHGLMVEVLPGDQVLITWFVFDAAGNSDWIQALGPIDNGIAKLTAYRVIGGAFPPGFDPEQTEVQYWGTISMVLDNCARGAFAWASDLLGYGRGGMALSRLTQVQGLQCGG